MSTVEILGKIILIPFFISYILLLSKHRFSRRTTLIAATAIVVLYFIVTFLIIKYLYFLIDIYPFLDLLYRIINVIVMTVFSLSLTRQRIVQSIFVTASVFVVISAVGVLAMAVLLVTGVPELPVRIIVHTVVGIFLLWARKPFTEFLEHTKKGWKLLCFVPIFLIAMFLFITSVPVSLERNPGNMPTALILCATTVIIYATLIFALKTMYEENRSEQNVMALQLFISSLEHQNELIKQNSKENILFRHDLRHIKQMMLLCADKGDIQGIKELLSSLENNLNSNLRGLSIKAVTGYSLPDSVLSYYIYTAKESGIDINVNIEDLDSIGADMTEFAVVLANSLENAVSACSKLPDDRKRTIRLTGKRHGKQYFIEISNTYAGGISFDPASGLPLSSREGHGFGSQSIDFFARKNNGTLQYAAKDGWLHLRILIALNKQRSGMRISVLTKSQLL